jgi:hypothetical protein
VSLGEKDEWLRPLETEEARRRVRQSVLIRENDLEVDRILPFEVARHEMHVLGIYDSAKCMSRQTPGQDKSHTVHVETRHRSHRESGDGVNGRLEVGEAGAR